MAVQNYRKNRQRQGKEVATSDKEAIIKTLPTETKDQIKDTDRAEIT